MLSSEHDGTKYPGECACNSCLGLPKEVIDALGAARNERELIREVFEDLGFEVILFDVTGRVWADDEYFDSYQDALHWAISEEFLGSGGQGC